MSSPAEMLKSVLVMQLEAVKALVTEYHQQTEAYVQHFGHLPLSHSRIEAADDARIVLRTLPSLAEDCVVSDVILEAIKKHCGSDMCATSLDHFESFLAIARKDVKTVEDRILHALFVLDASLTLKKEMQSRFEGKQGYELLVEWLAVNCSYNDKNLESLYGVVAVNTPEKRPCHVVHDQDNDQELDAMSKSPAGQKEQDIVAACCRSIPRENQVGDCRFDSENRHLKTISKLNSSAFEVRLH